MKNRFQEVDDDDGEEREKAENERRKESPFGLWYSRVKSRGKVATMNIRIRATLLLPLD
jgi:hypothetical protein